MDFQAQLELLRREKFTVLKLGQVVARLQAGDSLPARCAVITVDDAYHSFLSDGWPLLKRYGFPVTLFVSTDTVGGGDYLSWQELVGLQQEGVEIGSHSASHAYLLDRSSSESEPEWSARVTADIRRAQQAFREHLGFAPQLFAYPYGEFDPTLARLIESAGFAAAFGQQSGVITAGQDLFRLPRFAVGGAHSSLDEFRSKLFMHHLPIKVMEPESTVVVDKNPPTLIFYMNSDGLDESSLRCFAAGSSECTINKLDGNDGVYVAKALYPITGRRSKYTLTARSAGEGAWYWFSQLWIRPDVGEVTDHSVPR